MTPEARPIPRLGWDPLPAAVGVVGRVLVREDELFVAELRFAEHATVSGPEGSTTTTLMVEGAALALGS